MGQYYKPVSLEKMEAVYSHNFGSGLKLMEHSWIGNNFVKAVEQLISENGRWYGDRIVWAGDYADPEVDEKGEILKEMYDGKEREINLYDIASKNIIKPMVDEDIDFRYFVNLDTNEYVDLTKVVNKNGWRIHPLPLMTCEGNGRGGGDFRGQGSKKLVGIWARNPVTMTNTLPEKCKQIKFNLYEDW